MPFHTIKLNDGTEIPEIFFGTWKVPKQVCTSEVDQAVDIGFDGIDTAQVYGNEEEVGNAIKQLGLPRKDLYITTKWSGVDGKGAKQSCEESLEKMGISYIDLYLIHHPRLSGNDIPGSWKEMEALQKEGKVKSIGVSNFNIVQLGEILATCTIKPVVNQILLHPYVIATTTPLLEYMKTQNIVPEGYSTLIPLTSRPGGPVDEPVNAIAKRLGAKPEQILLAWSKAKGAIIVTTSSKKQRLEGYLDVGDIDLTDEDVAAIDKAGTEGQLFAQRSKLAVKIGRFMLGAGLTGYILYRFFC
ncbi:oxidoreductase [Tremella mesenterica]|uniref:Oxidoreductase n=1 Tax=Tremella mesenterica TaxID=5217 RepID=A0A4Q1BIL3_TREME|nr:oxidoreductase [Tremella mesenterica]